MNTVARWSWSQTSDKSWLNLIGCRVLASSRVTAAEPQARADTQHVQHACCAAWQGCRLSVHAPTLGLGLCSA